MKKIGTLGLLALMGCSPGTEESDGPVLSAVEFQTAAGSGEPSLFVSPDEVLLSWFEPSDDGQALRFARHDGSGWSEPRTITSGRDYFVNWADFPTMARMVNGRLLVHWPDKVGPDTYAYHVMVSTSVDDGVTWSEPVSAHADDSETEHGFVTVVPSNEGADLIWLDGRNTLMVDGERGAMQVRSGSIGLDGSMGPERLVDNRACDCCQTTMVRTASGLLAAYRDRSEAEIRDIAVSRLTEDGWSEPLHVGNDNWYYPACPVNGPSLSAIEDHAVVAWFAQPDGQARVQVAFTNDGGQSFGNAIRVDPVPAAADPNVAVPEALGRVDVELLSRNVALVSWLERYGDEGRIWARTVSAEGGLGDRILVSETDPSRRSGFPRMALVGDDVLFAWTMTGDNGGIRVARLAGLARIED